MSNIVPFARLSTARVAGEPTACGHAIGIRDGGPAPAGIQWWERYVIGEWTGGSWREGSGVFTALDQDEAERIAEDWARSSHLEVIWLPPAPSGEYL